MEEKPFNRHSQQIVFEYINHIKARATPQTIHDQNGIEQDGFLIEYSLIDDPENPVFSQWKSKVDFYVVFNRVVNRYCHFGEAVQAAKDGFKIAREGWNGKGMFVVYMPGLKLPPANSEGPGPKVNDRTAKHIGKDTPLDSQPYFALFNAGKQWQPGWVASQADMVAEDWVVL